MSQAQLVFLYRGIILFILGAVAVSFLSSLDQRWANFAGIAVFVAGGVFIIHFAISQFIQFLNTPLPQQRLPESLYLDRWYHLARLTVLAGVLLSMIFAAILLFIEPPKRCPGWHLVDERTSSLWLPFFMFTIPVLTGLSFAVIRWKWLVQKTIMDTNDATTVPVPYTLVATVLIGCAFSQFPWLLLLTHCWLPQ